MKDPRRRRRRSVSLSLMLLALAGWFVLPGHLWNRVGPTASAQFVDTLNANGGGALSPAERNQLVADLSAGAKSRAEVLRAVAEDQTLAQSESNRAFVLMQYFGYLRRSPNSAPDTVYGGYDFWLQKLDQFGGNFVSAEMVKAFISSIEYRRRFGQ